MLLWLWIKFYKWCAHSTYFGPGYIYIYIYLCSVFLYIICMCSRVYCRVLFCMLCCWPCNLWISAIIVCRWIRVTGAAWPFSSFTVFCLSPPSYNKGTRLYVCRCPSSLPPPSPHFICWSISTEFVRKGEIISIIMIWSASRLATIRLNCALALAYHRKRTLWKVFSNQQLLSIFVSLH